MSKFSRNRKRREREKLNSLVSAEVSTITSNLLEVVSRVPDNINEAMGEESLRLSFSQYNSSLCQIHKLGKVKTKVAVKKLGEITKYSLKAFCKSCLAYKGKLPNIPPYDVYYNGLPSDVDIYHIDIGGKQRMFYYIAQQYFCIVAIREEHAR